MTSPPKTLLIIWHSRTGGARAMARAAAKGAASEPTAQVRVLSATKATVSDLLAADAYLFVTPENLATMSGAMKEFFDRTYYPALGALNGRPYAAMICAGSDGEGAARQLARIAQGWRLKPIAKTLIIKTNAQTPTQILAKKTISAADLRLCHDTGAALSAGLALGIF